MSTLLPKSGLYAITPDMADTVLLLHKVEQALQGGVSLLQYRDKTSSKSKLLMRANAIHRLCLLYETPLIINDCPELAVECKAEGVHLGQSDWPISVARKLLGEYAIIGITCHHQLDLAIQAEQQHADYLALGRFFPSKSKPGSALADVETLTQIRHKTSIPIVAIGGLTLNNAQPIIDAGANYIAVIDDLFSKKHIAKTCQKYSVLFS